METKEFDPDWLRENAVWGGKNSRQVQKTFTEQSRWMTYYEIIFQEDGNFWSVDYGEGSTENQEEDEWEYQGYETITATRVVPVEVRKIEWVPYEG